MDSSTDVLGMARCSEEKMDVFDEGLRNALYREIIDNQPTVLLKKLDPHVYSKLLASSYSPGDVELVDGNLSDDVEILSSGPDAAESDSDEEWTAVRGRQRRRYCDLCTCSYTRQSDLDKHIRLIHGERCMPFSCDKCHRGFMRQESLTSHKMKVCRDVVIGDMTSFIKPEPHAEPARKIPRPETNIKNKRYRKRVNQKYSYAANAALDKVLASLDFTLPDRYRDVVDVSLSKQCGQCGVVYDSRTSMVKHFRIAHKDSHMPYSCHNCQMGFLDVEGLKIHLSKSKRFCAQVVLARSTNGHQRHVSAEAGAMSLPNVDTMPAFKTERELLSYLTETSSTANVTDTGEWVWCPVCNNSVSGNIVDHLREHKRTVIRCQNQKKLLCDVCLVETGSLDWMIKHQKLIHGRSLQQAVVASHQETSVLRGESEVEPEVMEGVSEAGVVNDLDLSSSHDGDLASDPAPVLERQHEDSGTSLRIPELTRNVIQIVPQDEMPWLSCSPCTGDLGASPGPMPSIEGPFPPGERQQANIAMEIDQDHADLNESEADLGRSPCPPVLGSPISLQAGHDDSQEDMPSLSLEPEDTVGFSEEPDPPEPEDTVGFSEEPDSPDDDVVLLSETRPSRRPESPIRVKLEKQDDKSDGAVTNDDSQSSSETVGRVRKNIKERSFMDALFAPLEQPFIGNTNATRSGGDLFEFGAESKNVLQDIKAPLQHLADKSISAIGEHFSNTTDLDVDGRNDEIGELQSTSGSASEAGGPSLTDKHRVGIFAHSPSHSRPAERKIHRSEESPGWGVARHQDSTASKMPSSEALSPGWSAARHHDSTESDSGVSEVKLDDEDLHDEVIVIDLDDKSVTTQLIPSNTVAEQSLDPGEHQALLRKTQETGEHQAILRKTQETGEHQSMLRKTQETNNNKSIASYTEGIQQQLASGPACQSASMAAASPEKTVVGLIPPVEHIEIPNSAQCDRTAGKEDAMDFVSLNEKYLDKLSLVLSVISDPPCEDCVSILPKIHVKKVSIPKPKKTKAVSQISELRRRKQYSRQILSCEECGKGFPSIGILNKHKRFAHPEPARSVKVSPYQPPAVVPQSPYQVPAIVPQSPYQVPAIVPQSPYQVPAIVPQSPYQPPAVVLQSPPMQAKPHSPLKMRAYPCSKQVPALVPQSLSKQTKAQSPPTQAKARSPLKMRAYPCSKCGEYFQSLALLEEHKRGVHNLLSKYLCLDCDRSFGSRGQLQSHRRWQHTVAKPKVVPPPAEVVPVEVIPAEVAPPVTTKAMLKEVYFPEYCTESSDDDKCSDDKDDIDYRPTGGGPKSKHPPKKRGRKPKIKPEDPATINKPKIKPEDPATINRPKIRPEDPATINKPKIKPEDPATINKPKRTRRVSDAPKEFKCRSCDIFFYDSNSRFKHEITHRETLRLPCTVCGASFVQQASLNRHMKTHQNVRYVCDVCGLVYVQTYSVLYHREKNHPDAPSIKSKQLRVQLDGPPTPMQRNRKAKTRNAEIESC